MRPHLGARLETCLSLLEGENSLVDVGTDHGKLPVYALKEGKTRRAVAVDISEKSLLKAKLLAEKEGVALVAVCSDGLAAVKEEDAGCVVIAGMGGNEIIKILSEAPFSLGKCLLVPHTHAVLVRRYLKEKNACILRDIVVKEGRHFYPVMAVDFRLPWRDGKSVYVGEEGDALKAYAEQRLKKINEYLRFKDDEELKEEKEILENVYGG